ncbi:Mu-like prophage major head subunit gpT family protein [Chelativorans alearense]|uniref:Mu-like prophage major head subunit gpT family protein n=1 Tax=Chelativorans alearense TaxID=2681495 RepID=UPI0013D84765|nr:Mu-like prophage major head subunit gpT family protein [Chelativorans alearense]
MIINTANLDAIRVGFSTAFRRGLGQAESEYGQIATTVPSTTRENKYGWLGKLPNLRQWVGPRAVHGIAEHDYAIKNISWELTYGVDRDEIEDDNLGVYEPMFVEAGESVAAQPDLLVWDAAKEGWSRECYDGQNFYDGDHPVLDADGTPYSVSNTDEGGAAPWFLMATGRSLKPYIFQERKKPMFVAKDNPRDSNVFTNKEFMYGVDCRRNVGYGFWQMVFASSQPLTKERYIAARVAIMEMKGDYGRPLGLRPNLLVVSPSNEGPAFDVLKAERDAAGATNTYRNTAELLVSPWLA